MLVNVGCGSSIHPAWCNLDLRAAVPGVREHDLRRGLPFDDDSCDAVYHSHVLEHLGRPDARAMLAECKRVLKPGGVLRVVVPDLEAITRAYLAKLDEAAANPAAAADHEWMIVELCDQMVRTRSGGEMGRLMLDSQAPNRSFIRSRLGGEFRVDSGHARVRAPLSLRHVWRKAAKSLDKVRQAAALSLVALVAGSGARQCLREAFFRQTGEIHRWMYDRVSLGRLLGEVGFIDVQTCTAERSRIPAFASYQLDTWDGAVRKPDSLFVEALKP